MKSTQSRVASALVIALSQTSEVCAQTCEPQWLRGNSIAGTSGRVRGLTVGDPDGNGSLPQMLIMGGKFDVAGTVNSNNVAGWDGENWYSFPPVPTEIHHVAISQNRLFIATVSSILVWNGASWDAVGEPGLIADFFIHGDELFICGEFTSVGQMPASRIAKWNGSYWEGLPNTNISGLVNCLTYFNDELIAGGNFLTINGQPMFAIAKFDGKDWEPVGQAIFTFPVTSLTVFQGKLMAASGETVFQLNGVEWLPVGSISQGVSPPPLKKILCINDILYVTGKFSGFGGQSAKEVAKWDGKTWSALADGITTYVSSVPTITLAEFQGQLIAGGQFWKAGTRRAANIALWNGQAWTRLCEGSDSGVYATCEYNGDLVVGGPFRLWAGDDNANGLSSWNGQNWQSFGGVEEGGAINAMTTYEKDLVVTGPFSSIGGVAANRIARWDGTEWSSFGDGLSTEAYALIVYEGSLIASARRWDGQSWQTMGNLSSSPTALTIYNNNLIAAGGFTSPAGLAKWNGVSWEQVGGGVGNGLRALCVFNGDLIVGRGYFEAGGSPFQGVARWNGTSWHPLGAGITGGVVYALAVYDGKLYATGDFTHAGGLPAKGISAWDGSVWTPLDEGLSNRGRSLLVFKNELVVGGSFNSAGTLASTGLAWWTSTNIPWFSQGPLDANATCIQSASFTATAASGYDEAAYEWSKDGQPLSDGKTKHGSIISGSNAATLIISSANAFDEGQYQSTVSSQCGESVSATATLTINDCGDTTGDGTVNVADLLSVISSWGDCPVPPQLCTSDIHPPPQGNGAVNVGDLLMVIQNWD